MCTASLVHHFDDLKNDLPDHHHLLQKPLFQLSDTQITTLKSKLGPA